MHKVFGKLAILVLVITVSAGCAINAAQYSKIMPSSQDLVVGPWKSPDAIKGFYNELKPYENTLSQLKEKGFDPDKTPNVSRLNYIDVRNMFLPANSSVKLEELDLGIQDCIKSNAQCLGYKVGHHDIQTNKVANDYKEFLLYWTKFVEVEVTSGWESGFYLFFKGKTLVYILPGNENPNIYAIKKTKKPLGPIQQLDIGDLLRLIR